MPGLPGQKADAIGVLVSYKAPFIYEVSKKEGRIFGEWCLVCVAS